MKIIERTKHYLRERNVTQLELASQLGVAFTSLNRLLNGKAGKASIALKLDAYLEEHGYPHDVDNSCSEAKEER